MNKIQTKEKMKKIAAFACGCILTLGITLPAQASLITIGTATYNGSDYNLIFQGELGSDGLVWLDFTNDYYNTWQNQVNWTNELSFSTTEVTIYSDYMTDIDFSTDWRLPSAGTNPTSGFNQTTSEMGDLFYNELSLDQGFTTSAELNATNFDNLIAGWHWSGTEYANNLGNAWVFITDNGHQNDNKKTNLGYGLAVHSGQVSTNPVPEPGTIVLFGIGLLGLTGVNRKKKGNCA
jgi:hypothetical protein